MIARIWHGVVPSVKADAYHEYLREMGIREYRATPGNRGCYVLRRLEGERAHFLLISLWESLDAIREFVGDDVDRAHYYPEDGDFLIELQPRVKHYEVLLDLGEDPATARA
jgi:heme-degrading monooxygenase HmoA